MNALKISLLLHCLFLGACLAGEPLELAQLKQIVAKEHDDKPISEALRIYPKVRAYEINITNTVEGQDFDFEATAKEKWVDGKYIVSDLEHPERDEPIWMVVEFDAESKTYRKYVVLDGELTTYQVGTRVGKTRSITWIDLSSSKFEIGDVDSIGTETHTDTTTTWRSLFFKEGKLIRTETGTAKKAQP